MMALECPYTKQTYVDAWEAGVRARFAGVNSRANPHRGRLKSAWKAGWDASGSQIRTQEMPGTVTRETHPSYFWPTGEKMPEVFRTRCLPCPRCERVLTDICGQNVQCWGRKPGTDLQQLKCLTCGHTWKLPVRVN